MVEPASPAAGADVRRDYALNRLSPLLPWREHRAHLGGPTNRQIRGTINGTAGHWPWPERAGNPTAGRGRRRPVDEESAASSKFE